MTSPKKIRLRKFKFSAKLVRIIFGGPLFVIYVPQKITSAAGKRGPIPVTAEINGALDVIASLSPAGNGRHFLRLNATTRKALEIKPGDVLKVRLEIHERAPKVSIPVDLRDELESEGVLDVFESFVAGKQRHIIDWIDKSARLETRANRIRLALEFAHRTREKQLRKSAAK